MLKIRAAVVEARDTAQVTADIGATLLTKLTEMLADNDSNGDSVHPMGVKRGDLYKALTGKAARWKLVIDALAAGEDSELTIKKAGKAEFITLTVKT